MELPYELKDLYRHWPQHIKKAPLTQNVKNKKLLNDIKWFIKERINIWEKKTSGASPPFTKDPILSTYRFCNIFREFDKQTIAFHTRLNPLRNDFPLWLLNMFYFRMVANIETINTLGLLSYNKKDGEEFYKRIMVSPRPRFGTPYVFPISTIMRSETPTREAFISFYLPSVMKKIAKEIKTWSKESVYDGVERILPLFGYNLRFLWTEVLIDVAYQYPKRLDLFKRFPIGPGSAPTFKRIDNSKDPSILVTELSLTSVSTGVSFNGKALRLSAENWEGVGCEFRKYTNLKNGHGRKRLYKKSPSK
ncbi:MAG: hypothetical protein JWN37_126 [Candidatus Nomurabacteria bacterium]|nr:hypothetical protein [Candidatus Nomurabacteria bacterium]